MEKLSNLLRDGVKTWLMQVEQVTWSKKPSNIVYESQTDYMLRFSFEHSNVFLIWVRYKVKFIHICIIFLIHDKLMWLTLALISYDKLTLAFVAKLWCPSIILSV